MSTNKKYAIELAFRSIDYKKPFLWKEDFVTIKDLLVEEIFLSGETFVANASNAIPYWTGRLLPGVEVELRGDDGKLPEWFDGMEVVAIGAADDGGLLVAVR